MKIIDKIFIMSITLIVSGCLVVSFITKHSFIKSNFDKVLDEKYSNSKYHLSVALDLHDTGYNKSFKLDKLVKKSDLIALVTLDDDYEKKMVESSTLGKYNIKKVFKGDKPKDNKAMIYEKNFLQYNYEGEEGKNRKLFYTITYEANHNFTNKNSEYIVFLNKTQNPIPGDKTDTYVIADDVFGIFNLNKNVKSKVVDQNKSFYNNIESSYKYRDIKSYDVIFNTSGTEKQYNKLKLEVLDKYNI